MSSAMENYICRQVRYWEQQKGKTEYITKFKISKKTKIKPFITISREYGCGAFEIAASLTEILNTKYKSMPVWAAYDHKLLEKLQEDLGFTGKLIDTLTETARSEMTTLFQTTFSSFPTQVNVYQKLVAIIRTLATNGNVVIVGRGGNRITKDMIAGFHVRLVAPLDWRVERVAQIKKLSRLQAHKLVREKTAAREAFFKKFVKYDLANPYNYHLTINNSLFTTEEAARVIVKGLKAKGLLSK